MATSYVLRVFAAPLTHHHLVVLLHSYNGSGFGREEFASQLDDNASENDRLEASVGDFMIHERYEAALDAIEEDGAFEQAIKGMKFGNRAITSLNRRMQVFALAPHLPLCESIALPDDHPVHDMTGKPIILSVDNREIILSAFAEENHPHISAEDADNFFNRFYGATAVICRD